MIDPSLHNSRDLIAASLAALERITAAVATNTALSEVDRDRLAADAKLRARYAITMVASHLDVDQAELTRAFATVEAVNWRSYTA